MTREQVEQTLHQYRYDLGRCKHLRIEIERLKGDLERAERLMQEDIASIGSPVISDMPRGTKIGNPTETAALQLASGYTTPEVDELRAKIAEKSAELASREETVRYVDGWLSGLSEREQWVIRAQVIDGAFWREVAARYRRDFDDYVSKDTLKRLRDRAMDMIFRIAV